MTASKDASIWSNLGLLYLHHNDVQLANEAFDRAQTLDPDYAIAWIGQALVAVANGRSTEATGMFEHAVTLTANMARHLYFSLLPDLTQFCSLKQSFNIHRGCSKESDLKETKTVILPKHFFQPSSFWIGTAGVEQTMQLPFTSLV